MLRHVTLGHVMSSFVHFIRLCYVTPSYSKLCYIILCYITLCYITFCYDVLCYVALCYIMLCYVMLCYFTFHYVMLCYIICITFHCSKLFKITLLYMPNWLISYRPAERLGTIDCSIVKGVPTPSMFSADTEHVLRILHQVADRVWCGVRLDTGDTEPTRWTFDLSLDNLSTDRSTTVWQWW